MFYYKRLTALESKGFSITICVCPRGEVRKVAPLAHIKPAANGSLLSALLQQLAA